MMRLKCVTAAAGWQYGRATTADDVGQKRDEKADAVGYSVTVAG